MADFRSFAELVLARGEQREDADAYLFLEYGVGGPETERLSYAGLDRAAKGLAAWLQDRGMSGRRVLLLYPSGLDFVKAFVGCLYAGVVAVPAPLPTEQGQGFHRVSAIVRDAQVGAVLTVGKHAPDMDAWLAQEGFSDVRCLATDAFTGDPAAWVDPKLNPDDLAFLQYTSGSTSEPKGVMVSHRNLLANEAAIQRSTGSDADTVLGGWLPFFHDMGLIGHVLLPLWLGSRAVLMSPTSFLRRPVRWLELVSEHRVTLSAAPNFAYDMCVRRVPDTRLGGIDLSSWRVACNGSEPVRADTLRAFAERFAPYGFSADSVFPCYGMAETTLLVSGKRPGRTAVLREVDTAGLEAGRLEGPFLQAPTQTLASSGVVSAEDFEVRIIDPKTREERPEGGVGEIWVRGASVSAGYWRRPEVNAETFGARIAGAEELGPWLRTGDLGAMEHGELFVTGRLKEVVLINGRNIYPSDVEGAVRALDPAFGPGAVFSVDTDQERLVAIHEVHPNALAGENLISAASRVQELISREFAVPAGNVLLVRPGVVRRTTSGKIQRTLMRKLFLDGAITPLHAVLDPGVRELIGSPGLEPVS
ncbi:fatty acyl-AMP ligase [Streptomyces sp. SID9727]|uniref:fatty acyl-AMP ligase n=1 Tax=Streptomyces sp. SID9727 TaxID=2706114 RepID=UPI0013C6C49C|nr:fatty acyl-AMP ligase [Streptomyces sp. SID9727]NEC66337.1 fatty acyl-AMP ligase [Streptomyces sp. SID9727]